MGPQTYGMAGQAVLRWRRTDTPMKERDRRPPLPTPVPVRRPAEPALLEYQRPAALPVLEKRFGRLATSLLTVNTVLGGAMVLAVFYADRLGLAAWMMLGCGILLIYAVSGLCANTRRFKRAMLAAVPAFVLAAGSLLLNWLNLSELEDKMARHGAAISGPVIVQLESGIGARYATLLLAWKVCAAATITSFLLIPLLGLRMHRVARARGELLGSGD